MWIVAALLAVGIAVAARLLRPSSPVTEGTP
jgi:hypothetical protein